LIQSLFTDNTFYKQALKFWEFVEFPFRANPDLRFLYLSDSVRSAIERTVDSIDAMGGFSAVWGDFGTGKTTLAYYIYWNLKLSRLDYFLILIPNPTHLFRTKTSVYRQLVKELGGVPKRNFESNVNELTEILVRLRQEGKKVIVFIDEVQDMTTEGMKTLRELSNIETSKEKMIHFVLFGSADVFIKLRKMRSLQNRIMSPSLLTTLNRMETVEMIHFRLRQALDPGSKFFKQEEYIFPEAVCDRIFVLTSGHPRDIVRLCHDAMRQALRSARHQITSEDVDLSWKLLREGQGELNHELQRTS